MSIFISVFLCKILCEKEIIHFVLIVGIETDKKEIYCGVICGKKCT
ncbi:hypothetical protein Flavo103_29660 [Flavobacterium collinsii]|nr:hypothetical protein Flavo103_29660 [Flavobacterium collinsii]